MQSSLHKMGAQVEHSTVFPRAKRRSSRTRCKIIDAETAEEYIRQPIMKLRPEEEELCIVLEIFELCIIAAAWKWQ